jgi:ribonuclease T2
MRAAVAALAALTFASGTAHAQAYQCRAPREPLSVPAVPRDGPVQRAPITGYTLALTWSPEYCRARRDNAADDRQCSGRFGRFGLVVHGLWPEGRGSAWPQWCPARAPLTSPELARNLCMTPSATLLAHEWAKHGACMAPRPESYFRTARQLWDGLRWPDLDRLAREDGLTAGRIRDAISQANRLWQPANIGLVLNERGWLQELRLCYDRRFRPAACTAARFGPADSTPVKIWRGL